MRTRGINYDTGFSPAGRCSRDVFEPDLVRHEMQVIAHRLCCNAVRITGGDPNRLRVAAGHAAAVGLEVWFAPFPCEMSPEEMLPYFADCAELAEDVRRNGAEVVLMVGCELSVFATGWLTGDTSLDRFAALASGSDGAWAGLSQTIASLNEFLAKATATVRERFGGRVTYAAGPWELIDWTPFDCVAIDAYRSVENFDTYRYEIRAQFAHEKPVVVTEFGTCAYRGAADRGGMAWSALDMYLDPPQLTQQLVRDEDQQTRYLNELMTLFDEEGVDGAFWFTFAGYRLVCSCDPAVDLDLASYGVVKMIDERRWEPKAVFHAMSHANRATHQP